MCGYFCIGFIDFMFKEKSFAHFTNLSSPSDFRENDGIILNHLKIVEYNSPNIYPSLNDQQFKLNKISEVRGYSSGEIRERELMSKRLSKYIAFFD